MTDLPPPPPPPPPPPAYGAPVSGAPRAHLALGGLVTALTVTLVLSALAALLAAYALLDRASLVDDLLGGAVPSFDELSEADDLVAATGVFNAGVFLVCGVLWIIWQFRYVANARALGRVGLGPGWAIGGWFIPCANFALMPTQLWQASTASEPEPDPARGRSRAMIVIWAVLWIGATMLSFSDGDVYLGDDGELGFDTPEDIRDSDQSSGAANIGFAGAAVASIVMLRSLTQRQTETWASRAGAVGGPPPPGATGGIGPYAQPYQPPPAAPPPG